MAWGSPRTDWRGGEVYEWAARCRLDLLNEGKVETCWRRQGGSIVDLTWATRPARRLICGWRVETERETDSDHRYITFSVATQTKEVLERRLLREASSRRWALRKMDEDAFKATIVAALIVDSGPQHGDLEGHKAWLQNIVTQACDAAMPRAKHKPKKQAYWWTEDIAELRRTCDWARRRIYKRKKYALLDPEGLEDAWDAYRETRNNLRISIRQSKARAWEELLSSLDKDPWGRPYKMVLNKLKGGTAPITETLDPQLVRNVIDTLFPRTDDENRRQIRVREQEWDEEEMGVTRGELRDAVKKIKRGKAPGPDGVHGKVWALAYKDLAEPMRHLYNECLKMGSFPQEWKRANIVLIPKEGKPKESPSAYRPICLLDEAGKILERIIVDRLVYHLSRVGPQLDDKQYGFRAGRSTVDAILRVRSVMEAVTREGGVLLAVSLDISNAFNTLPWHRVGEALQYHRVPPYLVNMVADYFRDRKVVYVDRDAEERNREMSCGVPQGSVLGPLMWNLAYDMTLRTALPPGCQAICYADDTLILAGGDSWGEAQRRANLAVARVVRTIKNIGLRVAPQKTEAVFLHNKRIGAPPKAIIMVEDTPVEVGSQIKYLGIHLDGKWTFGEHFRRITPRVDKAALALCRLLPNLGGPDERVRRLYAGTIHAMIMYGAPVWAEKLEATRKLRNSLYQLQRRVANRICRGFRTVSWTAAGVLSGVPPIDLLARMYAEVYKRTRGLQREGIIVTDSVRRNLRVHTRRKLVRDWAGRLEDPSLPGQRTVGAIQPCLEQWLGRESGGVTYRMTQVLTGHGCFGEYLGRIGKERTTRCQHCGHQRDTAQHTLDSCVAWAEERGELVAAIGRDLSLPTIVRKMTEDKEAWKAFSSFCETVMRQKEEKEREREQSGRREREWEEEVATEEEEANDEEGNNEDVEEEEEVVEEVGGGGPPFPFFPSPVAMSQDMSTRGGGDRGGPAPAISPAPHKGEG